MIDQGLGELRMASMKQDRLLRLVLKKVGGDDEEFDSIAFTSDEQLSSSKNRKSVSLADMLKPAGVGPVAVAKQGSLRASLVNLAKLKKEEESPFPEVKDLSDSSGSQKRGTSLGELKGPTMVFHQEPQINRSTITEISEKVEEESNNNPASKRSMS